ncbi:MAG: VWA domain-containing protein [Halobacteriota archaeon]
MNGTSDLWNFYALFPEPALAKDLITILEDYRINSRLQAEYPVLGRQISEMNVHASSKRAPIAELANDKQRAVELIAQRLIAGRTKEQVPEKLEQTVEQALSISQTLSSPHADVHETARVAAELYFLIDDNFQGPYQPVTPFSAPLDQSQVNQNIGNFGRTARKISEKMGSEPTNTNDKKDDEFEEQDSQDEGNQLPPPKREYRKAHTRDYVQMQTSQQRNSAVNYASEESVKELLRAVFKEKGIKPKDVESRIDALEPNKVKDYLSDLETLITDERGLRREEGTYLYPEWGSDIGDYRLNWSRVRERILEGGSDEFYLDTIQKYAGQIKIIRREFQMLSPEGKVKLRSQVDGDDIDLDSAVQYFIDKRLRLSPSERNYVRTERRTRDIAVAFLVDMSGSTVGATITCEKEALILMSEALKELGDAFAIYGFSGYGRDNVVFFLIKDFEDSYAPIVQCKISTMTNKQSTRIAPAIRHTTTKLRRREEKRKLLILLSDGKPLDRDYHGNYAIEDTRMALKEAQRYGIKSFCITVDREAAEYLPRMYANSRWVVINDVVKLPEKITRIYKRFTM